MPTLDATPKGESANSYATVAEADAFIDNLYLAEDWNMLSDDDKMRLLIAATTLIDDLPTLYDSYTGTQALNYPVSVKGVESGTTEVVKATIIQAWYMYNNIETYNDAVNESISNIKTQNLGSVQMTKWISGVNPMKQYDGRVFKILSPYLDINNSTQTDSTWKTLQPSGIWRN